MATDLDPTLQSNAAPVLSEGVAGAVNDNIVDAQPLSANPGSEAITKGASRNLGLENAEKKANELVEAHTRGMTPEERNQRAMALMSALNRAQPGPGQSPQLAEEAAETMKRLCKAVMKILKAMFGKGGSDPESNQPDEPIWMIGRGSSGYGQMHDKILEMLSKKDDEFEKAAKDTVKQHDMELDKKGGEGPSLAPKVG